MKTRLILPVLLTLCAALARADWYDDAVDNSRLRGYVALKYVDAITNEYYNSESVENASEVGLIASQAFNGYFDFRGSVRRDIDNVSSKPYQIPYAFFNLHDDFDGTQSVGLYWGIMPGSYGLFNDSRYDPYNAAMIDLPMSNYSKSYDFFASGRPGAEIYYKTYFNDYRLRVSAQRLFDSGEITDERITINALSAYFSGIEIASKIQKHSANLYNVRLSKDGWELNYNQLKMWFTFHDFATPIPTITEVEAKTVYHIFSGSYATDNWRYTLETLVTGKTDISAATTDKIGQYIGYFGLVSYSQPRWRAYVSAGQAYFTEDITQYAYYKALGFPPYLPYVKEKIVGWEYLISPEHKLKLRNEYHANKGVYGGDYFDTKHEKQYWGTFTTALVMTF